jgi:hypothetical protein
MGSRYLTDLASVLEAAGLTVVEVPEWETRARRTGGYTQGAPTTLMVHHTASPARNDGRSDVDYIVSGGRYPPISNLYTSRTGTIWVCAAGATNTNGKGTDTWGGGVPADRMNEYAISNEIANDGKGEPYTEAQQDAVLRSSVALCARYSIAPHMVRAHFEWAPSRKIDPSGPSRWSQTGGLWNMDAFRTDITTALTPPEEPPMNPMKYYALPPADMPDNPAHIVVIDAACRYRTNADTDPLPEIRLPEEQYLQLRKSAGLD